MKKKSLRFPPGKKEGTTSCLKHAASRKNDFQSPRGSLPTRSSPDATRQILDHLGQGRTTPGTKPNFMGREGKGKRRVRIFYVKRIHFTPPIERENLCSNKTRGRKKKGTQW